MISCLKKLVNNYYRWIFFIFLYFFNSFPGKHSCATFDRNSPLKVCRPLVLCLRKNGQCPTPSFSPVRKTQIVNEKQIHTLDWNISTIWKVIYYKLKCNNMHHYRHHNHRVISSKPLLRETQLLASIQLYIPSQIFHLS